jgi:uncharacterized membrane protein
VYFGLTLVAEDNIGAGSQVTFGFNVTNTGSTPLTGVTVVDNKLGTIPGSPIASLAPGGTQRLTATAFINQTTTNVATATATGLSCAAPVTASSTVTVLPPLACTVSQSFESLSDDKIVFKLTNTGNKPVTLNSLTLDFPSGRGEIKEVKLDGSIFKTDQSPLTVTSGVTIGASNFTNPDVTKRQLDPGESRKLEINFTDKTKATASDFDGTATFAEGCQVDLAP